MNTVWLGYQKYICIVFLFALFLGGTPLFAVAENVLVIEPDFSRMEMEPWLSILEDQTGDISSADVLKDDSGFVSSGPSAISKGFSSSTYWLKFQLKSESSDFTNLFLELKYPPIDFCSLDIVFEGGKVLHQEGGDRMLFSERPVEYRNLVFPFTLKPGQSLTGYLKVRSAGSLKLPFVLHDSGEMIGAAGRDQMALTHYLGALMVMGILNLFIFFRLRDICFLHYVIFIWVSLPVIISAQQNNFPATAMN